MEIKKKICAGFDGIEHEAYIYKNIGGKKYCKSCTYKLQPPKAIAKVTEKQKFKIQIKKKQYEDDIQFYLAVWYQRFGRIEGTGNDESQGIDNTTSVPRCECCQSRLWFEPTTMYFHHILEKSNYPDLRHEPRNIAVVCANCHNRYESHPNNVPYLRDLKEERKSEFNYKNKLLDSRHIIQKIIDRHG
jgi:hypothetical protein